MTDSPLHDRQVGDFLKVTDVTSDDSKAQLQRGRRDQQIFKGNGDALRGLAALDASGDPRHVADQFIHEGLPRLPAFFGISALDAMDKFYNRHHRKADLDFSVTSFEVFQDLPDRVASPLTGDHHARIED